MKLRVVLKVGIGGQVLCVPICSSDLVMKPLFLCYSNASITFLLSSQYDLPIQGALLVPCDLDFDEGTWNVIREKAEN